MSNRYSTNYRMNRVLREDRAALVVPIDHGLVWGRVPALEAPVTVMRRFISQDITGFMVSTGIVKQSEVDLAKAPALARILAIDAFWPTITSETGTGAMVASVEDAVRMGVDCIKMLLPWNVNDVEKVQYCKRIGAVVGEASKWHMPVMIEPVFLNVARSPEIIEAELEVARVAYDLGAAASTLKDIRQSIEAGAQGVVVGRKIWQRSATEAAEMITEIAGYTRSAFTRTW
jgi:fructose-bisphosphate aldolase, class I